MAPTRLPSGSPRTREAASQGRGRLLRDATNAELGQVVGALDRLGLIEKIITAVVAE